MEYTTLYNKSVNRKSRKAKGKEEKKMLETGIIYNDYEYKAGKKWMYATTNTRGKKNERRELTETGKTEIKRIAKETEYRSMDRVRRMMEVWTCLTKER